MTQWLLPVLIFLVWFVWIGACGLGVAVEDARRGVPEGERRGTSIFPGMPFFPLVFWGIAWAIDRVLDPWGSILIGAFHVVYGVVLVVSIARDVRTLRAIDGPS